MTNNVVFKIELFDDLDKFLKEIEDGGKTSKDDLLISASESKEYLSDFFENFISQFCKHTFGIEQGTSHTEYSIKLKDKSIFNGKKHEDILLALVDDVRDILYNRSDYLEQEYLEIAHEFEEFIKKVFPSLLRNIQEYLKSLEIDEHHSRITSIGGKWKRIFDGR